MDAPMQPTSEPPIVGMARSAAELVYMLRRSEQDIVNLMAEIHERHQSLRSIIQNLGLEERANFEAELPGLVHRFIELHNQYTADQQKATMTTEMSECRLVMDTPQA
jgi:hypothetical protein